MQSRPIKELLIILRDSIPEEKDFEGLCVQTTLLRQRDIITLKEMRILDNYLFVNLPGFPGSFRWEKGLKPPRIEWLNEKIRNL